MNGKKIGSWIVRDGIAAEGCSSMGAGSIGGKNYCGNLLWQSSLTQLFLERVLLDHTSTVTVLNYSITQQSTNSV